ncbi:hypothetical protein WJX77_001984 [Trebouxia sp. C0004]
MATETCCATWVRRPLHSRPSKIPHLQQVSPRSSFFLRGVPQLKNNKQASGYRRICRCNQTLQQASAGPDISLLRPELQREWHHAKNQHLGDRRITPGSPLRTLYPALASEYDTARNSVGPEQVLSRSGRMVFWKDASGHTWEQSPANRTKPEKDRSKRAAVSQRLRLEQQASSDLL